MSNPVGELLGHLNGVPIRVVDDPAKRNDYAGDIYGLTLDVRLPFRDPIPFDGQEPDQAPLWQPDRFLMPGKQRYAGGAHHRHPLSLYSWSAAGQRPNSDGAWAPTALPLVWDEAVNGPAESHYACSTHVVSARCLTSTKRRGERIYTVQHRYRMPVRMLVKGFRCPACTTSKIAKAKARSTRATGWSLTLDQVPFVAENWSAERNWPVPLEHIPAIRERFVDMECRTCGYYRINFADKLAGSAGSLPQGCPRCRQGSVSIDEKVMADVLARWAASNVTVTRSAPVLNSIIDVALESTTTKLAVEFDGSYWHRNSYERDLAKTELLIQHGWAVLRIRKNPSLPGGLADIPGAINVPTTEHDAATIAEDAYRAVARLDAGLLQTLDPEELKSFAKNRARRHRTTIDKSC